MTSQIKKTWPKAHLEGSPQGHTLWQHAETQGIGRRRNFLFSASGARCRPLGKPTHTPPPHAGPTHSTYFSGLIRKNVVRERFELATSTLIVTHTNQPNRPHIVILYFLFFFYTFSSQGIFLFSLLIFWDQFFVLFFLSFSIFFSFISFPFYFFSLFSKCTNFFNLMSFFSNLDALFSNSLNCFPNPMNLFKFDDFFKVGELFFKFAGYFFKIHQLFFKYMNFF